MADPAEDAFEVANPRNGAATITVYEPPRDLKIRVSTRLHLMLHIAKVRTGRSIGDVVSEALNEFFDRNPDMGKLPEPTK